MKWEYKYNPEKGGDWPFQVKIHHLSLTSRGTKDEYIWCNETFTNGTWYSTIGTFNFKNREDAMMFMLRWS